MNSHESERPQHRIESPHGAASAPNWDAAPASPARAAGAVDYDLAPLVAWRESLQARLSQLTALMAGLKPRERRTLELVAAGRLNKQIAAEQRIAERTVEGIRNRLLRKLGVDHAAQMIAVEVEIRLLTDLLRQLEDVHTALAMAPQVEPAATNWPD